MQKRVLFLAMVITLVLWSSLSFVSLPTAHATGGCGYFYTVRPGDWLAAIARRNNTTVHELIRLNPWLWGRIDWIYPGQVLCVSAQLLVPPTSIPALTLEAEYPLGYRADAEVALQVPLPSYQRTTVQLEATQPVSFTGKDSLATMIAGQPMPLVFAVRNGDLDFPASDITLYTIGTPSFFESVRLDSTKDLDIDPGCVGTPLDTAFGMEAPQSMLMTVQIESQEKTLPIHVSKVGVVPPDQLANCEFMKGSNRGLLSFALLPKGTGNPPDGQLMMHAYDPQGGPFDWSNYYAACEWARQQGYYWC